MARSCVGRVPTDLGMSAEDQTLSSELRGEALLAAKRPKLQPLIDHIREVAQGRDHPRTECAETIADSWVVDVGGTRRSRPARQVAPDRWAASARIESAVRPNQLAPHSGADRPRCLSHNPLASPVVANRGRRDPPLPVLIPMQPAVPAGTTSHVRPPSESTYSASADTGTNLRRPCFTVRSRPERISS